MDYNQLKALGSYCRAAGPHVHRARTVYRRAAGPHGLAVCCVSLLYRVLLKGVLYACC